MAAIVPTTSSLAPLSAEDLNGLSKAQFDMFDSIDCKDWERLEGNITPMLYVDYRPFGLFFNPEFPAAEYMAFVKNPKFLDHPTVKTQHLVGASHFWRTGENEACSRAQVRAHHHVYTDASLKTLKIKGTAYASNKLYFRKVDGVWKYAGIRPELLFSEDDLEGVMAMVM